MKRLVLLAALVLSAGCATQKRILTSINAGESKQQVIQKLGEPESASMQNGFDYLYFFLHDQAFGRDKNHYVFAFKDGKLVEFAPLPDNQQEMGLIDRLSRNRSHSNPANIGNSYIQTPDAYGPGIHMDQYGAPVRVVPQ